MAYLKTDAISIRVAKKLRERYFNPTLLFSLYIDDIKKWFCILLASVRIDENEWHWVWKWILRGKFKNIAVSKILLIQLEFLFSQVSEMKSALDGHFALSHSSFG